KAFVGFKDIDGFAKVMSIKAVLANAGNMALSLYAHDQDNGKPNAKEADLGALLKDWQKNSDALRKDMAEMIDELSLEKQ
ncbi:MAG: hypothetical protein KJ687_01500, partial [Proteobacteria bacterium]|nr:hypothetical protein [Pseudomonadota bacterium]